MHMLQTTTGYAAASPQTIGGQLFAIAYGLIGIPLMVLAAVDIGRFLSDVVIFLYSKNVRAWKRLTDILGFTAKKQQMMELVEIKAIKPQRRISRRRRRPRSRGPFRRRKELDPNAKRLPLSVNAAILLLFCCLGGLVYLAAGGNQKSFIEAFFITFNLVANLTMSEMPNDLNHALTLIYIILFVTCGLAVLSMCADLAASELKWLFLKIHYFGRKINWKRKVRKAPATHEQLEVEVKELLKIIEQIRRKYPDKDKITSSDILQYMHDLRGDRPSWVCITHHRRDTIAFMPQSIETLRFADEMDQDEQHSHRSMSRSEEVRV
uniref:Ion_trans_2 domain-containing protein n=1 Tax=Steinernema glaseri TaxID=37863 RepID=A0A1I7ZFW4_9BILA